VVIAAAITHTRGSEIKHHIVSSRRQRTSWAVHDACYSAVDVRWIRRWRLWRALRLRQHMSWRSRVRCRSHKSCF